MGSIHPCLSFDGKAHEAAKHYVSIFPRSKVTAVTHYDQVGSKATGQPVGSVMTVEFRLDGTPFMALNGGPEIKFNQAISLVVTCKDQREVDRYWARLSKGGKELPCGWVKDKYGVSWQVIPAVLPKMLQKADRKESARVMSAVMKMKKLKVPELKAAYAEA